MITIPIDNIPNQEFDIALGDYDYHIQLRTIQGFTYMSVWENDQPLCYSQICTPNNFINQYKYISVNGKLYFKCLDNEYPNYTKFNITQNLLFLTPDEVAQL